MSKPKKKPEKRLAITSNPEPSLYVAVTDAAKAARMSRSAWLLKAAEEKLARDSQQAA